MQFFSRLPRWLAGAFLLFCTPACVAATAYDCSSIQYWSSQYGTEELRTLARANGYSEADIAKAEACLVPKKKQAKPSKSAPPLVLHPEGNLEVGKRSPTLPPLYTAPVAPPPAPVEPVAEAPVVPAPVVIEEARSSWLWTFIKDLGLIVIIGSALGIFVNRATYCIKAYRSNKATT